MANRLATPDHLVDLNGVDELAFIDVDDDAVRIGAMTRHRTIERSDRLAECMPMLPEAAGQIAGPSVRNQGTLGGSIGEADPAGNYPAALAALEGTIHLRSLEGTRDVPVDEYFIAYMFTDLREEELIESVSIPTEPFPPERTGMTFLELKRAAQTFPTVSAATSIRVDDPTADEPVVEDARIAMANAADILPASRTPRPTSKAVPSRTRLSRRSSRPSRQRSPPNRRCTLIGTTRRKWPASTPNARSKHRTNAQ